MTKQNKATILALTEDDLKRLVAEREYGIIQRYFRLLRGWTGLELAICYSEALALLKDMLYEEEEIKLIGPNWIHMMEKHNQIPTDKRRRAILARLLGIPFAYFGLEMLPQPLFPAESTPPELSWKTVDVVEYRETLQKYCSLGLSGNLLETLQQVGKRIDHLHYATYSTHTQNQEKKEIFSLLCEYYMLAAVTAHGQRYFDFAIELLSRAIALAEEKKLYSIWAYALRSRAVAHLDKGETQVSLVDFAAGVKDFHAAVADFETVKQLKPFISAQRYGMISSVSGRAYAHIAQDQHQLATALRVVDEGGQTIKKEYENDEDRNIPGVFDEERFHLDKGAVYIVSPIEKLRSPSQALKELERASELTKPASKSRHIGNAIRQADAYFYQRAYPLAVAYGQEALSIMKAPNIYEDQHMPRLEALYARLRESSFGKDPDVSQFGVALLIQQRPDIFKR